MPAFRDIAYGAYANRASPLAVPVPAGVEDGDTLLALIVLRVTETLDTIAGWELVDGYPVLAEQDGGGFQVNVYLLRRTASSEPESYDFTWDGTGGDSVQSCGLIYAASGTIGSIVYGTPQVNGPAAVPAAWSPNITALAIDVEPSTLVVWLGVNWELFAGAQDVPPGTTPTFTQRLKAADSLTYVADGVFEAGGDTGNRTQAGSNSGGSDGWFGLMVGLQPAADLVEVPNVVGQSQSAATVMIGEAGLTLGAVTTGYSPTVPEGDVISQNPAAAAEVASGSAVDIVVSLGPEPSSDPESDPESEAGSEPTSDDLPPDVIAEIWAFELSNGKTAAQNLVEINAALTAPIVGPYTLADLLKLLAAVAAGQTRIDAHGGGAATVQFDSVAGDGVVVEAEMQGSERTSVSITPDGSS